MENRKFQFIMVGIQLFLATMSAILYTSNTDFMPAALWFTASCFWLGVLIALFVRRGKTDES